MQQIALVSLVVPEYDAALAFYVDALGFDLTEDTRLTSSKRWVVVTPPGGQGTGLLLAKAATPAQRASIGNQTGGRVFLFLRTDDFTRDYARYKAAGVDFQETPRNEPYGEVVVFADPFGNLWDLIEFRTGPG